MRGTQSSQNCGVVDGCVNVALGEARTGVLSQGTQLQIKESILTISPICRLAPRVPSGRFSFVSFSELPDGTSYFAAFLLYTATSVSLGSNPLLFAADACEHPCTDTGIKRKRWSHGCRYRAKAREESVFKMFVIGLAAFFIMLDILIFIYTD